MSTMFWLEILKLGDHSEDLVDLKGTDWQCVEWIHLAHDTDQWRAVVNKVTNPRVI